MTCNFLIASEVFEHVQPPIWDAFHNAFHLLKPGGFLILTVPFNLNAETIEHFPKLHDYRVLQFGEDEFVMINRTKNGRYELHSNLIFHGGPGTTLEMRVFCRADLKRQLSSVGFSEIRFKNKNAAEWGIIHNFPWSVPILAKRPNNLIKKDKKNSG